MFIIHANILVILSGLFALNTFIYFVLVEYYK